MQLKTQVDIKLSEHCYKKHHTYECITVNKVFDEFVLRECVGGIKFEVCGGHQDVEIDPVLVLRNCSMSHTCIKNASSKKEKRLRLSGKCCCEVFGKDQHGHLIRLKVVEIPCNSKLSIGNGGELCFNFNARREYPNASCETFNEFIHFLDEGRFELRCFGEALIDVENNNITDGHIVLNLGIFLAVKLVAEVQLCIPVLGYCKLEEAVENDFCEDFEKENMPSFNPLQLNKDCHKSCLAD